MLSLQKQLGISFQLVSLQSLQRASIWSQSQTKHNPIHTAAPENRFADQTVSSVRCVQSIIDQLMPHNVLPSVINGIHKHCCWNYDNTINAECITEHRSLSQYYHVYDYNAVKAFIKELYLWFQVFQKHWQGQECWHFKMLISFIKWTGRHKVFPKAIGNRTCSKFYHCGRWGCDCTTS